jgi:tripartite-type tricarboxylate transporter receptor subunit TctC
MARCVGIATATQRAGAVAVATVADHFAPIITIATLSQVLAVHPKVPANNFSEFVALARSRPDTINVGTSGNGSPGHLAIALLKQAGVPIVHVPYRSLWNWVEA